MPDKTIGFKSIIGPLITGYIKEMRAVGYKYTKGASLLKQFDALALKEHLHEEKLPKELVLSWTSKRPNEKDSTRIGRISTVRGLARYMVRLGYEAYIYPAAAVTIDRYSYVPYIFSKEELKSIFTMCDNYPISIQRFSKPPPDPSPYLPYAIRMRSKNLRGTEFKNW